MEDGGGLVYSQLICFLFLKRNYGSSLFAQCEAADHGCQQVLWLYGEDNQITEVGTMNLFLYWINEDGGNPPRCQLFAVCQSFPLGLEKKERGPQNKD